MHPQFQRRELLEIREIYGGSKLDFFYYYFLFPFLRGQKNEGSEYVHQHVVTLTSKCSPPPPTMEKLGVGIDGDGDRDRDLILPPLKILASWLGGDSSSFLSSLVLLPFMSCFAFMM